MKGVIFYAQSPELSIWGDAVAWTNTLEKFGYDYYVMVDQEGLHVDWEETKNIDGWRVDNINQALQFIDPNATKVKLDANGIANWDKFVEPENVCYICGPDSGTVPQVFSDQILTLPAKNLWAIECISAIWGKFH